MVAVRVQEPSDLERDPLLRCFADVRDRDLRTRDGLFIIEGEVVLRVLLESAPSRARALLLSTQMAEKLAPILPNDIPCYVAPLPLMQEIVGFPIHRGVL